MYNCKTICDFSRWTATQTQRRWSTLVTRQNHSRRRYWQRRLNNLCIRRKKRFQVWIEKQLSDFLVKRGFSLTRTILLHRLATVQSSFRHRKWWSIDYWLTTWRMSWRNCFRTEPKSGWCNVMKLRILSSTLVTLTPQPFSVLILRKRPNHSSSDPLS